MHRAVAEAVVRAIEGGDKAMLRAAYWPEATFWHNTDGVIHGADVSLGATEAFMDLFSARAFVDLRIYELPDGFLQQHRMTAIAPDGSAVALEGCLVCHVREGRILRVDEYVDSVAVAPIFAALTQSVG